jgi:hypothetical protein
MINHQQSAAHQQIDYIGKSKAWTSVSVAKCYIAASHWQGHLYPLASKSSIGHHNEYSSACCHEKEAHNTRGPHYTRRQIPFCFPWSIGKKQFSLKTFPRTSCRSPSIPTLATGLLKGSAKMTISATTADSQ